MLAFTINGVERQYDNDKLMFSEAMEIERASGMTTKTFEEGLQAGSALSYGVMFWLSELREIRAKQGLTLKEAIAQLPFASYDVNLSEPIRTFHQVVEPDPTEPAAVADGSTEPTSPATSEPQPQAIPSPVDAPVTSESSPNSSESAPGSGTA